MFSCLLNQRRKKVVKKTISGKDPFCFRSVLLMLSNRHDMTHGLQRKRREETERDGKRQEESEKREEGRCFNNSIRKLFLSVGCFQEHDFLFDFVVLSSHIFSLPTTIRCLYEKRVGKKTRQTKPNDNNFHSK